MRRLVGHDPAKFREQRTQLCFAALRHRSQHHASANTKQLPPKLTRNVESRRPESIYLKTRTLQAFGGGSYCGSRLRRDRRTAVILEVTNADPLQLILPRPAQWHRRRRGIAVVGTLHDLEQNFQVIHVARQRSDHAQQSEWAD